MSDQQSSSNDETRVLIAEEIARRDALIRSVVSVILLVLGATLTTVGLALAVNVWVALAVLGAIVLIIGGLIGTT